MAQAVAEGAREAGAQVDIKRAPELVPDEVARKSHYKFDQQAPIAKIAELAELADSCVPPQSPFFSAGSN
ncbi:hypothetical protein [Lysobacter antibioticus]|uniref:hypothetical protein n=1 Tax=Lysobacter antibioticus TaxID=84531 RepID=UPI0004D02367|nr:hypothetical protein [Lysobacter antibioticus]